jgi:hypothetical protein
MATRGAVVTAALTLRRPGAGEAHRFRLAGVLGPEEPQGVAAAHDPVVPRRVTSRPPP